MYFPLISIHVWCLIHILWHLISWFSLLNKCIPNSTTFFQFSSNFLLMGPNDVPMLYVTGYSRINFVIRNNRINVAQDLCFYEWSGEFGWPPSTKSLLPTIFFSLTNLVVKTLFKEFKSGSFSQSNIGWRLYNNGEWDKINMSISYILILRIEWRLNLVLHNFLTV